MISGFMAARSAARSGVSSLEGLGLVNICWDTTSRAVTKWAEGGDACYMRALGRASYAGEERKGIPEKTRFL
jgi:hypothetical protein